MAHKNEIEIEDKDVYIKFESSDSLDIKKALLEINASNVNMQIIAEKLKGKMSQEIKERAMARKSMRETAEKINELIEKLPKPKEIPVSIRKRIFEEATPSELKAEKPARESSYMKELKELQKKIAELG